MRFTNPSEKTRREMLVFLAALTIAAIAAILSSCSPVKRLERMQAKHPNEYQRHCAKDRVLVRDTLVTERRVADTLLLTRKLTDTLVFTEDRVRIKYVRTPEFVYIKGECLPDTVYRTLTVEVPQPPQDQPKRRWGVWAALLLFASGAAVGARWLLRSRR